MITAQEARQLATPLTIEEIEDRIRQQAAQGSTNAVMAIGKWNPEAGPVLVEAGYVIRRGGTNDECVVIEWKDGAQ